MAYYFVCQLKTVQSSDYQKVPKHVNSPTITNGLNDKIDIHLMLCNSNSNINL